MTVTHYHTTTLASVHLWLVLRFVFLAAVLSTAKPSTAFAVDPSSTSAQHHRIIVSTDIGGTDPDDFQSMVHLLVYADQFDLEGLISSPYGPGRKQDILKVIDAYAQDYANLKSHSPRYPTPDALRAVTKQGEVDEAPFSGIRQPTEGSQWIIQCARRDDPRPLYVLIWGGLEDLSQALHDAPEILPKLRVYWIGGPNKKWSPNAYQYLVDHHPQLWIIEANSTYRGWFVGGDQSSGDQSGNLGNRSFVSKHIAGHGALGDFFASQLGGTIKMGDTPSVAWLLHGTPNDPSQESWGGQFVRTHHRPRLQLDRMPSRSDQIEQFGILELRLPWNEFIKSQSKPAPTSVKLGVENQQLTGDLVDNKSLCFRFSPKDQKVYQFVVQVGETKMISGEITAIAPTADGGPSSSAALAHWYTDSLDPSLAEGMLAGARSVSRWRREYLESFAERMQRCEVSR